MATVSAIAANLSETMGFVQPLIVVMVSETDEYGADRRRLRMCWIRDVDPNGRRVIRIEWIEDKGRKETQADVRNSGTV
jgi:hypothetical protein